jgi:hypothetical protein
LPAAFRLPGRSGSRLQETDLMATGKKVRKNCFALKWFLIFAGHQVLHFKGIYLLIFASDYLILGAFN